MLRNFILYIDTGKKPVEVPVHINKLTESKTGLRSGYKGRLVRQVTVLAREDVEDIKTMGDIDCIVPFAEKESVLVKQTSNGIRLLKIDKSQLKEVFPSTRNLRVLSAVPTSYIKPYMFDGTHYELSIHAPVKKKVRAVAKEDKRMFNILYHGMTKRSCVFIAKYICFGREKYCAIYPDGKGFMMSNIIP